MLFVAAFQSAPDPPMPPTFVLILITSWIQTLLMSKSPVLHSPSMIVLLVPSVIC